MGAKGLSLAEKKYIMENAVIMTDTEMAKHLDRDIRTVVKARKKMGLHKGFRGRVKIHTQAKDKEGLSKKDIYKIDLQTSEYYRVLMDQFDEQELKYYEEEWATLSEQFSDIVHTERRQIDELIKAEILGSRLLRNIKLIDQEASFIATEIEMLRERIEKEDLSEDETKEDIQNRDELLMSLVHRMHSISNIMANDYQKNVETKRKIIDDLAARRKDRTEKLAKVGSTFLSVVEKMQDDQFRAKEGKNIELMKLARDKKLEEWRNETMFPDGSKDCVLLDEHSKITAKLGSFIEEKLNKDLLTNPQEVDKDA